MIKYLDEILKKLKKGLLPKETKDLDLFDIKQLKTSKDKKRVYYRIRKGKYRAIFYLEEENIYVIALDKREEVYKKWQ